MKNILKAIGKAVCYLMLFLLTQVIVSGITGGTLAVRFMLEHFEMMESDPDALMLLLEQEMGHLLDGSSPLLAAVSILSSLLALGIVWLVFRIRKKKMSREIALVPSNRHNILAAVVYGFALSVTVSSITVWFPFPQELMDQFLEAHNAAVGTGLLSAVAVAVVAPITEEVFFRGLVYTRLKKGMGIPAALILSSLIFGLCHGELVWIAVTFPAGLAMAWIYERTGSLWCSITVHAVNNTVALLPEWEEMPTIFYYAVVAACAVLLVLTIRDLCRVNPCPRTAEVN